MFFEKFFNIKCYANPSSWSRDVPRGRTDGWIDRDTETTKLIVTFVKLRTRLKMYSENMSLIFCCQMTHIPKYCVNYLRDWIAQKRLVISLIRLSEETSVSGVRYIHI